MTMRERFIALGLIVPQGTRVSHPLTADEMDRAGYPIAAHHKRWSVN